MLGTVVQEESEVSQDESQQHNKVTDNQTKVTFPPGSPHNGFLLETSPVLQNEALEGNSLEEEEKVHPKLKELRGPW